MYILSEFDLRKESFIAAAEAESTKFSRISLEHKLRIAMKYFAY